MVIKAHAALDKIKIGFQTMNTKICPNPILVIGNQKSGTTVIAALLSDMTGLPVTLDLSKEIDNPTYHRVLRNEIPFSEFIRNNKLDFSREIIKEPNMTLLYRKLTQYFPRSKIVFIIRDPRDNIRSILNRLNIPGNLPNLVKSHRVEITKAWDLIIDLRWLGLQGDNYIEMLTHRWNLISDVYLNNQEKLILSRYEDFLKDKAGEISRLVKRLGLAQVNDISDKVDIQFQPPGNRNIDWLEFFGEDNLTRIEGICGVRLKMFDYPFINQH